MPKKSNTEEFINKARAIHGDRYDYSECVYVGSTKHVSIICKEHGIFKQTPNTHLDNHGCPMCGTEATARLKRMSVEEFICTARGIHGDKYNYDQVRFNNKDQSVLIKCPTHGEFMQTAFNHLKGSECPKCMNIKNGLNHRLSESDFILRSKFVHGDKYGYKESRYTTSDSKITIRCKKHGLFQQTASAHMAGHGCDKCRAEQLAKIVADNPVGWTLTNWIDNASRSNEFDGFKVYLVLAGDNTTGEYFLKVGRTFTTVGRRLRHIKYKHKLIMFLTGDARDVFAFELKAKKYLKPFKALPQNKFGGRHECFSISALDEAMRLFEESKLTLVKE